MRIVCLFWLHIHHAHLNSLGFEHSACQETFLNSFTMLLVWLVEHLYNQLSVFFDKILLKYQCGFRKGFNVQHYLISLLEKWRQSLDQGLVFRALLTDLSKAFNCLSNEVLVGKLIIYGVEISSVRLIYDYLTNTKQRPKIRNNYSFWRGILSGVPQGSILGPRLFYFYIRGVFFLLKDMHVASYADDTTPCIYGENIEPVKSLEKSTNLMFNWFKKNQMKGNEDKCHVLLSTDEMV